jgi:mono/diheme cytochrome c family protein
MIKVNQHILNLNKIRQRRGDKLKMNILKVNLLGKWLGLLGVSMSISFGTMAMDLTSLTHVHGIAPSIQLGVELMLAGHDGLYRVLQKGKQKKVEKVGDTSWDIMSLSANAKGDYLASGHPSSGGNSGLMLSTDGGLTWVEQSAFTRDPEDFNLLTVSPANPDWIYGFYKTLMRSEDGGKHWKKIGQLPAKTLSIAASKINKYRLYAGTEQGLLLSNDSGKTWSTVAGIDFPVTAVNVNSKGQIALFEAGDGVLIFPENKPSIKGMFNGFGIRYLKFITQSKGRYWGVDQMNTLWVSSSGSNWTPYVPPVPKTALEKKGKILFDQYCVSCHGKYGVGESYSKASLTTKNYQMAPSLDWTMHAWHHTDENLTDVIQNSFKNAKMPAWKGIINLDQTQAIIAYIKSLWHDRERSCQGPRHMTPACQQPR